MLQFPRYLDDNPLDPSIRAGTSTSTSASGGKADGGAEVTTMSSSSGKNTSQQPQPVVGGGVGFDTSTLNKNYPDDDDDDDGQQPPPQLPPTLAAGGTINHPFQNHASQQQQQGNGMTALAAAMHINSSSQNPSHSADNPSLPSTGASTQAPPYIVAASSSPTQQFHGGAQQQQQQQHPIFYHQQHPLQQQQQQNDPSVAIAAFMNAAAGGYGHAAALQQHRNSSGNNSATEFAALGGFIAVTNNDRPEDVSSNTAVFPSHPTSTAAPLIAPPTPVLSAAANHQHNNNNTTPDRRTTAGTLHHNTNSGGGGDGPHTPQTQPPTHRVGPPPALSLPANSNNTPAEGGSGGGEASVSAGGKSASIDLNNIFKPFSPMGGGMMGMGMGMGATATAPVMTASPPPLPTADEQQRQQQQQQQQPDVVRQTPPRINTTTTGGDHNNNNAIHTPHTPSTGGGGIGGRHLGNLPPIVTRGGGIPSTASAAAQQHDQQHANAKPFFMMTASSPTTAYNHNNSNTNGGGGGGPALSNNSNSSNSGNANAASASGAGGGAGAAVLKSVHSATLPPTAQALNSFMNFGNQFGSHTINNNNGIGLASDSGGGLVGGVNSNSGGGAPPPMSTVTHPLPSPPEKTANNPNNRYSNGGRGNGGANSDNSNSNNHHHNDNSNSGHNQNSETQRQPTAAQSQMGVAELLFGDISNNMDELRRAIGQQGGLPTTKNLNNHHTNRDNNNNNGGGNDSNSNNNLNNTTSGGTSHGSGGQQPQHLLRREGREGSESSGAYPNTNYDPLLMASANTQQMFNGLNRPVNSNTTPHLMGSGATNNANTNNGGVGVTFLPSENNGNDRGPPEQNPHSRVRAQQRSVVSLSNGGGGGGLHNNNHSGVSLMGSGMATIMTQRPSNDNSVTSTVEGGGGGGGLPVPTIISSRTARGGGTLSEVMAYDLTTTTATSVVGVGGGGGDPNSNPPTTIEGGEDSATTNGNNDYSSATTPRIPNINNTTGTTTTTAEREPASRSYSRFGGPGGSMLFNRNRVSMFAAGGASDWNYSATSPPTSAAANNTNGNGGGDGLVGIAGVGMSADGGGMGMGGVGGGPSVSNNNYYPNNNNGSGDPFEALESVWCDGVTAALYFAFLDPPSITVETLRIVLLSVDQLLRLATALSYHSGLVNYFAVVAQAMATINSNNNAAAAATTNTNANAEATTATMPNAYPPTTTTVPTNANTAAAVGLHTILRRNQSLQSGISANNNNPNANGSPSSPVSGGDDYRKGSSTLGSAPRAVAGLIGAAADDDIVNTHHSSDGGGGTSSVNYNATTNNYENQFDHNNNNGAPMNNNALALLTAGGGGGTNNNGNATVAVAGLASTLAMAHPSTTAAGGMLMAANNNAAVNINNRNPLRPPSYVSPTTSLTNMTAAMTSMTTAARFAAAAAAANNNHHNYNFPSAGPLNSTNSARGGGGGMGAVGDSGGFIGGHGTSLLDLRAGSIVHRANSISLAGNTVFTRGNSLAFGGGVGGGGVGGVGGGLGGFHNDPYNNNTMFLNGSLNERNSVFSPNNVSMNGIGGGGGTTAGGGGGPQQQQPPSTMLPAPHAHSRGGTPSSQPLHGSNTNLHNATMHPFLLASGGSSAASPTHNNNNAAQQLNPNNNQQHPHANSIPNSLNGGGGGGSGSLVAATTPLLHYQQHLVVPLALAVHYLRMVGVLLGRFPALPKSPLAARLAALTVKDLVDVYNQQQQQHMMGMMGAGGMDNPLGGPQTGGGGVGGNNNNTSTSNNNVSNGGPGAAGTQSSTNNPKALRPSQRSIVDLLQSLIDSVTAVRDSYYAEYYYEPDEYDVVVDEGAVGYFHRKMGPSPAPPNIPLLGGTNSVTPSVLMSQFAAAAAAAAAAGGGGSNNGQQQVVNTFVNSQQHRQAAMLSSDDNGSSVSGEGRGLAPPPPPMDGGASSLATPTPQQAAAVAAAMAAAAAIASIPHELSDPQLLASLVGITARGTNFSKHHDQPQDPSSPAALPPIRSSATGKLSSIVSFFQSPTCAQLFYLVVHAAALVAMFVLSLVYEAHIEAILLGVAIALYLMGVAALLVPHRLTLVYHLCCGFSLIVAGSATVANTYHTDVGAGIDGVAFVQNRTMPTDELAEFLAGEHYYLSATTSSADAVYVEDNPFGIWNADAGSSSNNALIASSRPPTTTAKSFGRESDDGSDGGGGGLLDLDKSATTSTTSGEGEGGGGGEGRWFEGQDDNSTTATAANSTPPTTTTANPSTTINTTTTTFTASSTRRYRAGTAAANDVLRSYSDEDGVDVDDGGNKKISRLPLAGTMAAMVVVIFLLKARSMELFGELDAVRLSSVMALDYVWATRLVTFATLIVVVVLWFVIAIGCCVVCWVGYETDQYVDKFSTITTVMNATSLSASVPVIISNSTSFVSTVVSLSTTSGIHDLETMGMTEIIVLFATAAAVYVLVSGAVIGSLRAHARVVERFSMINLNARTLESALASHMMGHLSNKFHQQRGSAATSNGGVGGAGGGSSPSVQQQQQQSSSAVGHHGMAGGGVHIVNVLPTHHHNLHHQNGMNAVNSAQSSFQNQIVVGNGDLSPLRANSFAAGGGPLPSPDDPDTVSLGDEGRREGVFGSITPAAFAQQFRRFGEASKGITLAGKDLCIDGELLIYTYDSEYVPKFNPNALNDPAAAFGVVTASGGGFQVSSGANSPSRAAAGGGGGPMNASYSSAQQSPLVGNIAGGGNNAAAGGKPPPLVIRSLLQDVHRYTAIVCVNKNGNITFWNYRMEVLTGYRQMDVVGSSFYSLIVGGEAQTRDVKEAIEWTRNDKNKFTQLKVDVSSGKLMQKAAIPFEFAPFPAKSVDGTTEGVLLVGNADVTSALKKIADELFKVQLEHSKQQQQNQQRQGSASVLGGGGGGITSPTMTSPTQPSAAVPEPGDFAAVNFTFMGGSPAPKSTASTAATDAANANSPGADLSTTYSGGIGLNATLNNTTGATGGTTQNGDLTLEKISRVFARLNDTIELMGSEQGFRSRGTHYGEDDDDDDPANMPKAPLSIPALVGRIIATTFSTRKINISMKQDVLPVTTLDEEKLSFVLFEAIDHYTRNNNRHHTSSSSASPSSSAGLTLHIGYDVKRSGAIAFNFQPTLTTTAAAGGITVAKAYPKWEPTPHATACLEKLRATIRSGFRGAVTLIFLSTVSSEAIERAEQYQQEEKERQASLGNNNKNMLGQIRQQHPQGNVPRVTASSPSAAPTATALATLPRQPPQEQIRINIALLDANPITNTIIRTQSWGRKHLLYFIDDLESLDTSLDSVDVLFIRFPKTITAARAALISSSGTGGVGGSSNNNQLTAANGGGDQLVTLTADKIEKILGRLIVERTYLFVVLVEPLPGNPTNLREVYGERVTVLQQPVTIQALLPAFNLSEDFVVKKRNRQRKTLETRELFMTSKTAPWTRGRQLGQGSFATVYEATNTVTKGKMAVRIIKIDRSPQNGGSADSEAIDKLVRDTINEIKLMASLEHKNIISYFYCEKDVNAINVFMEYAERGSLLSAIKKSPAALEVAAGWVRDILFGLEYLHDQGVVHLDLKAANVLLTADGTCKLADFGTARQFSNVVGRRNSIAVGGPNGDEAAGGTLHFMAPEVLAGEPPTWQADIWSLGCVVIELLTGRPPHSHIDNPLAVVQYIARLQPGDAPLLPSTITNPDAVNFIRSCLRVDPEERPTIQTLLLHPFIVDYAIKDNALYQPKNIMMGGAAAGGNSGNGAGAGGIAARRMTMRGGGGGGVTAASISDDSSDRKESIFSVWGTTKPV